MNTVYKYPIPRGAARFELLLPEGFKFLRVGFQGERLFLWAEVNTDNTPTTVRLGLFGTGHEVPTESRHLATYDEGPFVFHLYQL